MNHYPRCTPKRKSQTFKHIFGILSATVQAALRMTFFTIGLGAVMFGLDFIFKLFIR